MSPPLQRVMLLVDFRKLFPQLSQQMDGKALCWEGGHFEKDMNDLSKIFLFDIIEQRDWAEKK